MTGYRVSYTPDGAAVPIAQDEVLASRTWFQWLSGEPKPSSVFADGAAVFYVNNSAAFMVRHMAPDGTRSIPHFILPGYQSDGKTYVQLTPDGPLKP